MIIPNKDKCFEKSLLMYSINIFNSFYDKIDIIKLYNKYSNIKTKDMDAIMLFLYLIGKIDVVNGWVIKIDKESI